MFEPLLEAVRREVSGERALQSLIAVTGFHRVQASPGYDAAAAWLAGQLEPLGLDISLEHVAGDGRTRLLGAVMPEGWDCARARATLVEDGRREPLCDWETLELSVIQRSDPASGCFPLVALDDGTEDAHYEGLDVRGRVVLSRGPVMRVHQLAVVERGAAGILSDTRRLLPPVRGPQDERDAVNYTSFWWEGDAPRGWGFVLSTATGERLRQALRDGRRPEVEVEIVSRRFATRIPLLSAALRGADGRRDADARGPGGAGVEALVVAHLCHPRPSANDNASGVAAALEAARALAALRRRGGLAAGPRGVRFLWVPELTGTCAWLGREPGRARRIAAAVNLDMVGEDQQRCGSTFLLEHPPCFMGSFAEELMLRIRRRAQDWVTSYSGPGHFSLARLGDVPYSGGSDHAVFIDPAIGVPCPMLIQWPDRFYHSSHDTPDKSDPASLALAARCAATYAAFVAGVGGEELSWLAAAVGRGARRRLLAAANEPDPGRALEAERVRGAAALASLARLGAEEGAVRAAVRALDEFCLREGFARHDEVRRPAPGPGDPVPERLLGAPLDSQRHLLPGWRTLPRAERERFRAFEAAVPGGATTLETAWYACDGRRTLDEIARLVWLETGHHAPEALEQFFDWTERLGLSRPAAEAED